MNTRGVGGGGAGRKSNSLRTCVSRKLKKDQKNAPKTGNKLFNSRYWPCHHATRGWSRTWCPCVLLHGYVNTPEPSGMPCTLWQFVLHPFCPNIKHTYNHMYHPLDIHIRVILRNGGPEGVCSLKCQKSPLKSTSARFHTSLFNARLSKNVLFGVPWCWLSLCLNHTILHFWCGKALHHLWYLQYPLLQG